MQLLQLESGKIKHPRKSLDWGCEDYQNGWDRLKPAGLCIARWLEIYEASLLIVSTNSEMRCSIAKQRIQRSFKFAGLLSGETLLENPRTNHALIYLQNRIRLFAISITVLFSRSSCSLIGSFCCKLSKSSLMCIRQLLQSLSSRAQRPREKVTTDAHVHFF